MGILVKLKTHLAHMILKIFLLKVIVLLGISEPESEKVFAESVDTLSCINVDKPNINYELNCKDQKKVGNNMTTITVSMDSGPLSCKSSVYPTGTSKVEMTYKAANDGFDFGTNTGATIVETYRVNQFLALSNFFTNNVEYRRRIATFPSPTSTRPWYINSWSISECPGDFTESATCTGVLVPYGEIPISTKQDDNPDSYCIIEPSKIYYLNFVHDQYPYDGVPGRCGFPSDTQCSIFTSEVAATQP